MSLTRSSTTVSTALYTIAAAVAAMTASSVIQLLGVTKTLKGAQFGDRALALTVEELRALLSVVLGVANLALLFLNRALAYEQQAAQKAELNLSVLQKQAKGMQSEYLRATSKDDSSSGSQRGDKAEVSKLISDKARVQEALEVAQAEAKSAASNAAALKAQSQGLEREYDRLLAENDNLKRRLARFDAGFSATDKKSA
ncbi:hypothetical protein OEZ85_012733 [Tetradesmus obliquus]|uniref:Endoplasmic reticulum transmembrane protein n=1 Tax=Tetradesmus obliquus TaxID=3088 RepID=A0ABY8U3H3_TETOB|nr:hypothetical protein OEZ85_012733 [Tetradesmus obliquus]